MAGHRGAHSPETHEEPKRAEKEPHEKSNGEDASAKLAHELNKAPLTKLPGHRHEKESDSDSHGVSTLPKLNIYGRENNERYMTTDPESLCRVRPVGRLGSENSGVDKRNPYVDGPGVRDALQDPELRPMGRAFLNAEKSGDNFQVMKALNQLPNKDIRFEFESAQSVVNRDLGRPSIRIGVDEQNIHLFFKKTDVTLPYNVPNDTKQAPSMDDPKLRQDLLTRLQSGMKPEWGKELTTLSTSELSLFDSMSRADGPALRSAMSTIKTAEELDHQFQNISNFANARGLSNWGNIIWSNDLKSLTVYNGVAVYSGRFPIKD